MEETCIVSWHYHETNPNKKKSTHKEIKGEGVVS
jgi:hypothetical protein